MNKRKYVKSKSKVTKKAKSKAERANIPSGFQTYRGPLRLSSLSKFQGNTNVTELASAYALQSNGSGIIQTVVGIALANFNNYSNFGTLYDEFRILSCIATYQPNAVSSVGGLSTIANTALVGVLDMDTANVLTGYAAAYGYESAKLGSTDQKMYHSYRMNGSEDAQFTNATATNFGNFKYYANGATTSTVYGYIFIKCIVQGRGRDL
jgi:hypothetical protein